MPLFLKLINITIKPADNLDQYNMKLNPNIFIHSQYSKATG